MATADLASAAVAATEVDYEYEEPEEATLKLLRRSKLSQLPRYRKGSGVRVNGDQSVTLTFHGTDSAHNPTSHQSSHGNGHTTVDAEENVVDPSNCSVYLDELQGKWKCHHCNWTYFVGTSHSGGLGNHRKWKCRHCSSNPSNRTWLGNHGLPNFSSEIKGAELINGAAGKNGVLSNELTHQYGAIAYNGKLSASGQTSCNGLVEKITWNGGYRVGGLDSMEEERKGVTESNVETVLEKQDTHDMYCPDCSSCITRRVVPNRRKQYAESTHPAKVQGHNVEISPDNGNSPAVNDSTKECGAGSFTCLSCFRFFIAGVQTADDPGRVGTSPQNGIQTSAAEQKGIGGGDGYRW